MGDLDSMAKSRSTSSQLVNLTIREGYLEVGYSVLRSTVPELRKSFSKKESRPPSLVINEILRLIDSQVAFEGGFHSPIAQEAQRVTSKSARADPRFKVLILSASSANIRF
jgi:hypothetical protein